MGFLFAPNCTCCEFCHNGFGNIDMQDAQYTIGEVSSSLSPVSWSSNRITTDPFFPEAREVVLTTATPGDQRHVIYHLLDGAVYTPSVEGAIVAVNLSMAAIFISGGSGLADWGIVVKQDGYYYTAGDIGFINNAEQAMAKTTSSIWYRDGVLGAGIPNFTTGSQMELGFYLGSETPDGTAETVITMRAARPCLSVS
jgi:hypothetical protein